VVLITNQGGQHEHYARISVVMYVLYNNEFYFGQTTNGQFGLVTGAV
jgi:hypothetical protein